NTGNNQPPAALNNPATTLPLLPTPEGTAPATAVKVPGNVIPLQGVVIGTEQSGDSIIKTAIGTLKVQLLQPLPAGSTVNLEVSGIIPAIVAPPAAGTAAALVGQGIVGYLLKQWGALEQAAEVSAKHTGDPASRTVSDNAAKAMQHHVPSTDQYFGAK